MGHLDGSITCWTSYGADKARLKLPRETIILLSTAKLGGAQGGDTTVTKGVGCEPSGIRPCE